MWVGRECGCVGDVAWGRGRGIGRVWYMGWVGDVGVCRGRDLGRGLGVGRTRRVGSGCGVE